MASRYRGIELRYGVNLSRLPPVLRRTFVELEADDSTRAWIDDALTRRRPYAKFALRALAMTAFNIYDASGIANACQDRLLGSAQWQLLLGAGGSRLLDVGAGDGFVTRELATLFTDVATTELSAPMARRLRARGYACHQKDLATATIDDAGRFDVVALQNVIDRTTHPLRLIDRAGELLAQGGRLVIALPVPIDPVVFSGPTRRTPAEALPTGAKDFESAVATLHAKVFEPRGWNVTAWSRAPYLCNGSASARVSVLDDAIFVLAR
jgi:SAM-dependent methyltransferase